MLLARNNHHLLSIAGDARNRAIGGTAHSVLISREKPRPPNLFLFSALVDNDVSEMTLTRENGVG